MALQVELIFGMPISCYAVALVASSSSKETVALSVLGITSFKSLNNTVIIGTKLEPMYSLLPILG